MQKYKYMRDCIVFMALIFGSNYVVVFAQWIKVYENPGVMMFLDVPSLASPLGSRVVEVLTDYREPEDDTDELVSMINSVEFICELRVRRVLSGTHYAGNLGQGVQTYFQSSPGPWKRVEKTDIWDPVFRLVCDPVAFNR